MCIRDSVDDIEKIDPKTQAIRIAHTIGAKKRIEISTRADEKGVRILNPMKREEVVEEEGEEMKEAVEAVEHEEGMKES
mgnify:FL=1